MEDRQSASTNTYLLVLVFPQDRVICIPDWPRTCHVAEEDLLPLLSPSQVLELWVCRIMREVSHDFPANGSGEGEVKLQGGSVVDTGLPSQ